MLVTTISCEKETPIIKEETSQVTPYSSTSEKTELAYPEENGEVKKITHQGQPISVEKINEEYIFEGDIIVHPDSENYIGKSTGRTKNRWPHCTIYYTISSSLANKARVYNAISHWEQFSNLRFVPRTLQPNYVTFRTGSGCSSSVGRTTGQQFINLSTACTTGNTIHEIGHAAGLLHEQSRKDRGSYVNINFNNILAGKDHNFKTYLHKRL